MLNIRQGHTPNTRVAFGTPDWHSLTFPSIFLLFFVFVIFISICQFLSEFFISFFLFFFNHEGVPGFDQTNLPTQKILTFFTVSWLFRRCDAFRQIRRDESFSPSGKWWTQNELSTFICFVLLSFLYSNRLVFFVICIPIGVGVWIHCLKVWMHCCR